MFYDTGLYSFSNNTDVVYDPEVVGCLVRILKKLLKTQKNPPEVYMSSTIRNPGTYTCFKNELGEFNVRISSISEQHNATVMMTKKQQ